MKAYLLFIPPQTKHKDRFLWLFKIAIQALNLKNVIADDKKNSRYETISLHSLISNSQLSEIDFKFFLKNKNIAFNEEGLILHKGREDELMTAFYLVNSLQEYDSSTLDTIGRFQYEHSWQKRFKLIEHNFVAILFKRYFSAHFPQVLNNAVFEKSQFFVSHDIDSLYGAFLQDGLAALKNGRLDVITKLIFNAILLKPEWFNIDRILKIENEYDLKSTFFWIVNKGRVTKALTNADYNISSTKLRYTLQSVVANKSYLGLHKSISDESFDEELSKLNVATTINRNHYLRFSLPKHYQNFEDSSFNIDCSLGFAEHYGFRNSLGIPFVPFNVEADKPYSFLEVPLNLMDGTFQKYMKLSPEQTSNHMIEFVEKNNTNSVISVLWHNHFFNSYRFGDYFKPYIHLLDYIKENNYSFITPEDLHSKYYFS